MQSADYDLCVIGGGINGAGIARDAAGRGLSVLLVEADDLASGTSSASTKLIHGGLRYLQYGEFKLVRESLKERETLLGLAPHIIWPLDFVLPYDPAMRPYWMIRLGLFLYDHLTWRKKIHASHGLNLAAHEFGAPLRRKYRKGFCYADCWAEDSRLVVVNAMDAAEKGAHVVTRTVCTKLSPEGERWHVHMKNTVTGQEKQTTASMVVNASGPWVAKVLESSGLTSADIPKVRLVKGSHIIIKKAFEGDQAYILQQADGRIVFAIPYEHEYTLIGTTEEDFAGNPAQARISDGETKYLLRAYNESFEKEIHQSDIIWAYSGVRPLFNDGEDNASAVTRDYRLHMHEGFEAPLLSVFGGKLTTYRVLAEEVVGKLMKRKGLGGKPWTAQEALPGGDILNGDFDKFLRGRVKKYSWLPPELVGRYARTYGTRMERFLEDAKAPEDLGAHYGEGVFEAELVYLVKNEWVRDVEDLLWRRSKLGMHVTEKTIENIRQALPNILEGNNSDRRVSSGH